MRAPSAGVPAPGGRPAPSGRTLMSQAARSAGLIGFPSRGACAKAARDNRASVSATASPRSLSVDMSHLPTGLNRPTCDRIEVLVRERGNSRNSRQFAARCNELCARRLHVTRFIPRPALQDCRAAVPPPRHSDACERLAEYGRLQRGLSPALAAIGGNHHFRDAAVARICEAGNLIETRTIQSETG